MAFEIDDHIVDHEILGLTIPLLDARYVNITGDTMTGNLSMGNHNLTSVNLVSFNTSYSKTGAEAIGSFYWNSQDSTADLRLNANVTLQVGQETLIRVVNKSGADISDGVAVYLSGAQGQRPKIDLAQGNSDTTSKLVGLTTEPIANNQEGFVTVRGLVRGIQTNGANYGETWADGDTLWVSYTIAGGLTNVPPVAPNHQDQVGYVVNANPSNGEILVQVHGHKALVELSDVDLTGLVGGSILEYDDISQMWTTSDTIGNYATYTYLENNYLRLDAVNGPLIGDLTTQYSIILDPRFDSTTLFQVRSSVPTINPVFTVDSVNGRVGVLCTPSYIFDVLSGGNTTNTRAVNISGTMSGIDGTTGTGRVGMNFDLTFSGSSDNNGGNQHKGMAFTITNNVTPTTYNTTLYGMTFNVSTSASYPVGGLTGIDILTAVANSANPGGMVGLNINFYHTFTTGTRSSALGVNSTFRAQNVAGGTTTEASAYYGLGFVSGSHTASTLSVYRTDVAVSGTATVPSLYGFWVSTLDVYGGSTTNQIALHVSALAARGGTVTNAYGLKIGNITAGTNKYAIVTGTGLNSLNDQLLIVGSADRIQEIVRANATQTTNLVEWQNSSSTVLAFMSGTGTFKSSGRKQAIAVKSGNYTLTANDEIVVFTATATATLPASTGTGQTFRLVCRGGILTIDANASETIKGELTQTLIAGEDLIITDVATGVWE